MLEKEEIVNGDDLRGAPGRNEQRMRGVDDVDASRRAVRPAATRRDARDS